MSTGRSSGRSARRPAGSGDTAGGNVGHWAVGLRARPPCWLPGDPPPVEGLSDSGRGGPWGVAQEPGKSAGERQREPGNERYRSRALGRVVVTVEDDSPQQKLQG